MKTVARYSWDYRGFETDSMDCFIGTGPTLADAVMDATLDAHQRDWDTTVGLGLPDLAHAMTVQIEDGQEEWLVTLFVSDEPLLRTAEAGPVS